MKIARMTVDGQEYPLCFSVRVIRQCTDRYGGVENIDKALDSSDPMTALDEAIWLLTTMMAAGERYAKKHDIISPPALSVDEFYDLCDTEDLSSMKEKIFETITTGQMPDVEVQAKNAEATQGD